mmetsp:Transcript_12104/g.31663  ORF Transcript_12104/g.31663 Transcript_12104/m.31663 type:complete len:265 (-) Transcript_12104:295-1089(-)
MAYQEMATHIPLFAHPSPKSVLIVGGGDGGVLREVCRHACVTSVTMCEIDRMVVDVSKRFFGDVTATAFDDPRLELVFDDAAKFVETRPSTYDVVIVDSSDPVGPAETLFTSTFYAGLMRALRPGGIICNQGECQWLHLDLIGKVLGDCARVFDTVEYAFTTIPTYPCGQIGFLLCSTSAAPDMLREPRRLPSAELQAALRYYSPAVHRAAFVLPRFAEKVVGPIRKNRAPLVRRGMVWPMAATAVLAAAAGAALAVAVGGRRA